MKEIYTEYRGWILATAIAIYVVLVAACALRLGGWPGVAVLATAVVAGYHALCEERLIAVRTRARLELDRFRRELVDADEQTGHFAWLRDTPNRPAVTAMLRHAQRQRRALEVKFQEADRLRAARRIFWSPTERPFEVFDCIAFDAGRLITQMIDSEFWRGAASWLGVAAAYDADEQPRKQRLTVIRGGKAA